MRIGGRGRQSTRKDTDQTKELAAKKESANTKKGRSTRKEPGEKNDRGGILLSSEKEKERMLRHDKNRYDKRTRRDSSEKEKVKQDRGPRSKE